MLFIRIVGVFFFVNLVMGCGQGNTSPLITGKGPKQTPEEEKVSDPSPSIPLSTLTHPASDSDFMTLNDGRSLELIKVRGSALKPRKGTGNSFTNSHWGKYLGIKKKSEASMDHKTHWAIMNLDTHKLLANSANGNRKIFGASSSKIYVAATLLDKQGGNSSDDQLQDLAEMLVVSSNSAWVSLQKEIGGGSANKGRELNYNFTQKMGYPLTRGWQGYWGNIHGNELVAIETVEMLYDTYQQNYPGADVVWKLMYTCRTGANRGLRYIPDNIYVGGKTGTYDGSTENPQTGETYNVRMRNHVIIVNVKGVQYGIAIFSNDGSNETVALLVGGLLREFASL